MRNFFTKPVTLPVWGLVVIALVALALGAAGGASDKEDKVAMVTPTTSEEVDERPTPVETTTTGAATATTVAITAEQAEQVFASLFNERRVALAESLEEDSETDVESVDRLEYDQKTDFVILEVTSVYQTQDLVTNAAWAITRSVSPMFDPKGPWRPGLRLVVNQRSSTCSPQFMQRLAEKMASRSDWERECR